MQPSLPAGIQSLQTESQDSELVQQGIYRGFPGVQERDLQRPRRMRRRLALQRYPRAAPRHS